MTGTFLDFQLISCSKRASTLVHFHFPVYYSMPSLSQERVQKVPKNTTVDVGFYLKLHFTLANIKALKPVIVVALKKAAFILALMIIRQSGRRSHPG